MRNALQGGIGCPLLGCEVSEKPEEMNPKKLIINYITFRLGLGSWFCGDGAW